MTAINHAQAREYLLAAADDLLSEDQAAELAGHLRDCAGCRAEAQRLQALETGLKQSFRARWDILDGPSANMTAAVRSQARRIAVTNRLNFGMKMAAGIIALALIGIITSLVAGQLRHPLATLAARNTSVAISTQSARPTNLAATQPAPGESSRLMTFVSTQDGNSEIYVMKIDGSGLRNLTNNPGYDGNPQWSPDGSKIVFESDRDGSRDIFTMNPDGSGVARLTNDPANEILGFQSQPQNLGSTGQDAWSPDGRFLLLASDKSGNWLPFVAHADGSGAAAIGSSPIAGALWSPGGDKLATLLYNSGGWGEIRVVNNDGSQLRTIATGDPLSSDNNWKSGGLLGWSADEKYLYYRFDTGDGYWDIFRIGVDGAAAPQSIASGYALSSGNLFTGWIGDGSSLYYATQTPFKPVSAWHNTQNNKSLSWDQGAACAFSASSSPSDYPVSGWRQSAQGAQVIAAISCPAQGYSQLFYVDLQTAAMRQIAKLPVVWSDINISWSADGQAALLRATNQSTHQLEIYPILAADLQNTALVLASLSLDRQQSGFDLQPVPFAGPASDGFAQASPAPASSTPAAPLWNGSSQGNLIAYTSNASGNSDIYIARSDGSGTASLTHSLADETTPVWSPDGGWIAFSSAYNLQYSLRIMRPDGSADATLFYGGWSELAWSPDSTRIALLLSQPQDPNSLYSLAKTSLRVVGLDGRTLQDIALGSYNQANQLRWSGDGKYLFYVGTQMTTDNSGVTTSTESALFRVSLDGGQPVQILKSAPQIDAWSSAGGPLSYLARDVFSWNFIRAGVKLAVWEPVADCMSNGSFSWDSVTSVYNRTWSPDGKRLLLEVTCPDDNSTWFFLGNTSGKFVKLINYTLGNEVVDPASWSPDGRLIVFSSDLDATRNSDLYVLDVEAALRDPATRPARITSSGFNETSPAWQPEP